MRFSDWGISVLAVVLACGAASAGADIVYNSTTTSNDFLIQPIPLGAENGDDVTLAGTARKLTEFFVPVYADTPAWVGSVTATFYNNDGAGGAPGSVLWTDTVEIFDGLEGVRELTFSVTGEVILPNSFTWALSHDTTAGNTDFCLILTDIPPTVGSSDAGVDWYFDGVEWTAFGGNYEARITAEAVPEPGTAAALGLAGVMGLGLRRRK